uniref:Uncharacterized protein n=1 Tax=Magallana gigas TaxID=29159 RepID=K1QDE8_MAGGI
MRSPVDKERDCDIKCADPMLLHQDETFWERSLWIGTPSKFLNVFDHGCWITSIRIYPKVNSIAPKNKTTENGLCEITQVLRDRLELSKKRESLIHGNRTGRYPFWYGVKTKCFLNLPNEQEDEKFRGFWKELTNAIQKQASQKVIDLLSNHNKEKENEANKIRTETIKKIGFATQESSSIRNQLDKDMLQLHEENTKELEEFRRHLVKRL